MTQEEQCLIEDNLKLVHKFCHNHNITDEDVKADIILYLCRCIDKFDESKGTISTFMYTCMNNALRSCWTITDRKLPPKNLIMLYLDKEFKDELGDGICNLDSLIGVNDKEFENLEFENQIVYFMEKSKQRLKPSNYKILLLLLEGKTITQIAEIMGFSYQNARERIGGIRQKVRKYWENYN